MIIIINPFERGEIMADFYVEMLASTLRSLKSTGTFDDIKKLKEQVELSNIINSAITVLNNDGYSLEEKKRDN